MKKSNFIKLTKSLFNSKIFIAIIAMLIGVISTIAVSVAKQSRPQKEEVFQQSYFKNLAKNDLELWEDFNQFHQKIDDYFAKQEQYFRDMQKEIYSEFKNIDNNSGENNLIAKHQLKQTQENNQYIYQLDISGYDSKAINVDIKNDNLIISSNQIFDNSKIVKSENDNKKKEDEVSKMKASYHYRNSSFEYQLALPKNIIKNPDIIRSDKQIIIKFQKQKL